MRELHLAEVLAAKRREKGVTQDQIAAHVGVSKASVSKWETGLSFPDITLLPILAAYFDISIDQLMGYEPQLKKDEIKAIYDRLSNRFAESPFDEVQAECEALIKKYNSCYPFLLEMAQLYINHASLAKDADGKAQTLQSAIRLCERIRTNSPDARLISRAAMLQALCYMTAGRAEQVLGILGDDARPQPDPGMLIAQAHQALGNTEKAQEVIQVGLYLNLMCVFNGLLDYVRVNITDYDKAMTAFQRAEEISELFQMQQLNPNNAAIMYVLGAHLHQSADKHQQALEMLGRYVDVCTRGFFPCQPRGDAFFDKISTWIEQNASSMPRSEATIKKSMLDDVLLGPVFEGLHDNPEYIRLVQRLRDFAGASQND